MKITDLEYIKQVIELLKSNDLNRIEIKDGETSISLDRYEQALPTFLPSTQNLAAELPPSVPIDKSERAVESDSLIKITSPIVGVFYSSSSPDSLPFVKVGDAVKKGDVLCVIEAMKFFNEITAEQDGTIAEICMKNGDVVEFGQTLFKLES